jgi:cytochrome c
MERGGVAEASVAMGEQIFNQKCIACHRFDQRLVGPSYNEVLPKYEGNLETLKDFILNPVKVNPDYPAMPNQGLKPIEAESAAMYLLQKYQEASGQQ